VTKTGASYPFISGSEHPKMQLTDVNLKLNIY